LFIPQVIYEHREPWWNDIDRGKLLIRPPVLSDYPTKSSCSKAGENGEGNYKFGLTKNFCKYFEGTLKSYYMGPTALDSLRRKAGCGF
jgi:hypothetical protein